MAIWTDLATWRGPTVNEGDGDGVSEPGDRITAHRLLVAHIAEGTFEGTIAWQLNPSARVSSTFISARDGRAAQMVDTDIRAWTQSRGNPVCNSIEFEGFTPNSPHYRAGWEFLTPKQIEFAANVFAREHTVYGVPLQLTDDPHGAGLGWHGMGGDGWGGHYGCPGEAIKAQLPQILSRATEIVNGYHPDEGVNMTIVVNQKGSPACWYGDGSWWKAVRDDAHRLQLEKAFGPMKVVDSLSQLGIPPTPDPPVKVTMSDADRAAIIAGVATQLAPAIAALRGGVALDTRDIIATASQAAATAVRPSH